ncbi:alpha/beta hydrolase [Desulfobacula sp.]|uniref:alpha/beta hydrolase n=1 Tax=Desulfobacula sp. TaxID=2593537 RepID=UPI00260814C8|nr:alpha/beta hydrolase [Desulfobacula sp.]
MFRFKAAVYMSLLLFTVVMTGTVGAVPNPTQDSTYPNVFYGSIPAQSHLPADVGLNAPVLAFIHGVSGTAMSWWVNNNMYQKAYDGGFRTVFISLNPDNTPNQESIASNAAMLQTLLPHIATHYGVQEMYVIGHSKGGVDIQGAMLDPGIADLVRAVFTISSPHQGTELADWAYDNPVISEPLNLLNPAVKDLQTENMAAFRSKVDPILNNYGIPFYTISGTVYEGHPITEITGKILKALVPGVIKSKSNDGFVTVSRTWLPDTYASELDAIPFNHFHTDSGGTTFQQIQGRIRGLEFAFKEFDRVASAGFSDFGGDSHNSWIWSAKWFNGALYVGTGREIECTSLLVSDVNTGTSWYTLKVLGGSCPDINTYLNSLQAEIWRYTPSDGEWRRVYKSPNLSISNTDPQGNLISYNTARDIGYRGMAVFEEENGETALYIGGVTSGAVFDPYPFGQDGFPPPRLLRTTDGINFSEVPQDPNTFLGEIGNTLIDEKTKFRSFRSLRVYNGTLFATLSDFIGSGVIIASANPSAGNDAWQQVSPPREEFPVWIMEVFNDYLYVATGLTEQQDPTNPGYGVYKTKASGEIPYTFIPVVENGGYQSQEAFRSPNGLSIAEFNGQLYMGTNRPTELIRINPDDTWDLVVGEPRDTPDGHKSPISGFGNGFCNGFNGHFWRMASDDDYLYLGTWDWSTMFMGTAPLFLLNRAFTEQYGFDLYRSADGIHWDMMSLSGMTTPDSTGVRSLEPTPYGMMLGTAGGNRLGASVFQNIGGEGGAFPAPEKLKAATISEVGQATQLTWDSVPGASRYFLYRTTLIALEELFKQSDANVELVDKNGDVVNATLDDIVAGKYDYLCDGIVGDTTACAALQQLQTMPVSEEAVTVATHPFLFPVGYQLIAVTENTTYSESAPTDLQSIYFVRAENSVGDLSVPSNIVAAPSKANPSDVIAKGDLDGDGDIDIDDINVIKTLANQPASANPDADIDGDGIITVMDARMLMMDCTLPRCARP